MKKTILLLSLSFTLILAINSCKKDDDGSDEQNQITENGLVKDIPPLQNDTIIVNSNMSLSVNQPINENDFNTTYTLNLNNFPASKVKKGTVIIDNSGKGRLWVITEVSSSRPSNNQTSGQTVSAVLGSLASLYRNVIIEFSTPGNRAKTASNNPNKLENGKFKFITANGTSSEINIGNLSIPDYNIENGISFSVNSNTISLNFNNFQVYSNANHTLNVTIPSGSIKVNNALDLIMKYNPIEGVIGGVTMNLGAIKDLKTSLYTDIDTDLNLNFQTTTAGNYDIVDEEATLGHYWKLVPVGHIIVSIDVKLKAKLNINTSAELNITPHIINKNNFETRIVYDGSHLSNSNLNIFHQNVEKSLQTSVTGDFNLNQRLEVYPEVQVFVYGLIGPSGKIIPYEEFNAHAHLNNSLITWDENVKVGLDYYASLDVSLFHFEHQTSSLAHVSGNFFDTTIYHSPHQTEIVSGNNQTGTGGVPLSSPIKVKVTDNLNFVASHTPVFFEVVSGGGSVDNAYVYTDSNGFAEVNWTLGNVAGAQSLKVYLKDGNENVISGTTQTINATASGTSSLPTLTTLTASNITNNSAYIGGDISSNGGSPINARGVCYSTNPNPTTADATTNDGTGTGSFTSNLTGLTANTTYYVRAYATNGVGTAYGNEVQFITNACGGTYNGNVTLTTQQEVNDFGSNCYSEITGELSIIISNDITDLSPLSSINVVTDLRIQSNSALTTLSGLENITSIRRVRIENNSNLINLNGLENLTQVTGWLVIMNNNSLSSLSVFSNLTSIGASLTIRNNDNLINLNGLNSITTVGATLEVSENDNLTTLSALSNLTYISGRLKINRNNTIQNLNGLNNIISVFQGISIISNPLITNLDELNNIHSQLTSGIAIENNILLTNIDGLSGITEINRYGGSQLRIVNNNNLNNLNGLSNITDANGATLTITDNSVLSNLCGLTNLINSVYTPTFNISNNQYNPTRQNIIDGNCSN